MRVQSYLTYHMQDPFPDWNVYLNRAHQAGRPFRSIKVFHPEDYATVKAASPSTTVVYRSWADKANQGRWVQMAADGRAEEAAAEYVATWIDSVRAHMPTGYVESLNEEYPTGNLSKLRAIAAFDMAFIRVVAEQLPNHRAVVFTAAVGNPGWDELAELLPLASLARDHGAAFGYHGYHPVKDKVSGVELANACEHLHLRFEGIDFYLRNRGIRVDWFIGEGGAMGVEVLDPPPGGDWGMSVVNGWKYPGVWDGDIDAYINDLAKLDRLLAATTAAKEGRLLGLAIFTSRPGTDPAWYKFNLVGGDASRLADLVAGGVEVSDPEPPPPPPPPPADDLRSTIWQASIEEQIAHGLSLNADAGLQKAIVWDGLVPVTSEASVIIDGQKYVYQAAEHLTGAVPRRVYIYQPNVPIWWIGDDSDYIVVEVVDELPKHPTLTYYRRPLDDIEQLVIHHTVSVTSRQGFARYHVDSRGWPGIGYHFLIYSDGRIYQTNWLETISYHVGATNGSSVGIALVGNFTYEPPTSEALDATAWLVQNIQGALGRTVPLIAHRQLSATQCPGNTWRTWIDQLPSWDRARPDRN